MQKSKPPEKTGRARRTFAGVHDLHTLGGQDGAGNALIGGRYEVLDRIGKGGMANVFLARDSQNGEAVAIKLLAGDPERHEELTNRLFVEARAAAKINHENVIEIKDIGIHQGRVFCVLEYVEGRALSALLGEEKQMAWERAAGILSQVCDALDAAHSKGILHRDLKPENIMLIERGNKEIVKVLDFGLAKLTDNPERLTRENIILGTPSYMAPEQAWSKEYDHRVDIYSLGIMAYELACGSVPFRSDVPDEKARTFQVLLMHKEAEPAPPSERNPAARIPPDAEAAIMRAISKNPDERFYSAGEFRDALLGMQAEPEAAQEEPAEEAAMKAPEPGPHASANATGRDKELVMEMDETWGRWLAAKTKRALLLGAIAAAIAIPLYHFRDDLRSQLGRLKEAVLLQEQPADAGPEEGAPQKAAPDVTGTARGPYQARIESTPAGAFVYQETGIEGKLRKIGSTPLDTSFENWENPLVISKRGYRPAKVVITRTSPAASVTLRRAGPPARAQQDAAPQDGSGGAQGGYDENEGPAPE